MAAHTRKLRKRISKQTLETTNNGIELPTLNTVITTATAPTQETNKIQSSTPPNLNIYPQLPSNHSHTKCSFVEGKGLCWEDQCPCINTPK